MNTLAAIAAQLMQMPKGLLAADESMKTIQKRFDSVGVQNTPENRHEYRKLLFSAPQMNEYISGVILFDETLRDAELRQLLQDQQVALGIKVDQGTLDNPDFPGEKVTDGLSGLSERLSEYAQLGAVFTKWRAVITIGDGLPTKECIDANVESLCSFASLSQKAGMVPIVEPEVLMDGNHTLKQCRETTYIVLKTLFSELIAKEVSLPGLILKVNMVIPGKESSESVTAQAIADATVRVLEQAVPADIGGVVFLSGGQTSDQAVENLEAICAHTEVPFQLSFSFSRALQEKALVAWSGKSENRVEAQEIFLQYAKKNSKARKGVSI